MDQSDDAVRLLEELRDIQREHLAEYRRVSQEVIEMNRAAFESNKIQSQRAVEASRSFMFAIYVLIALCLGANLWILVRLAGRH